MISAAGLISKFREKGVLGAVRAVGNRLRAAPAYFTEEAASTRLRVRTGLRVAEMLGHRVRHGPFRGMRLSPDAYWGAGELGVKALGLYEKEVADLLARLQQTARRSLLIDIGGADGFYAVGGLLNGNFDACIVFERSDRGREMIARNAALNGVADRLTILGEASGAALTSVIADTPVSDVLILCDIEGGEYDLLDAQLLERLRDAVIIVEIHEFDAAQHAARARLMQRAESMFDVEIIRTRGRDLSGYPELETLTDLERSLLISEGRAALGEWWLLNPKARPA